MSSLWVPFLFHLAFSHSGIGGVSFRFASAFVSAEKDKSDKWGIGEFAAILLISNAVQNSMNGGDNSITGGLILSTVIVGNKFLLELPDVQIKKN